MQSELIRHKHHTDWHPHGGLLLRGGEVAGLRIETKNNQGVGILIRNQEELAGRIDREISG